MNMEDEISKFSINSDFDFPPNLHNDTEVQKELECMLRVEADSPGSGSGMYCPQFWDTVLCWPKTLAGTTAFLPCFEELNGIKYDTSQNASRLCHINGTWEITDYKSCKNVPVSEGSEPEPGIETTATLYLIGYSVSLLALIVAVWIFLYFKDLRCLRNTIHTNLMTSYILTDFFWILTVALQISMYNSTATCIFMVIVLHYFHLTNFFWMFVEGLYLYMLVVETFAGDNIKLRVYVILGWGAPVLIVLLWAIVKTFAPAGTEVLPQTTSESRMLRNCAWWEPHTYDWIYKGSALGVLTINCVFLVMIMWVLITKLRATNNAETQQYRKATKALLVLIPLLGITYILIITGPTEGIYAAIYGHLQAVLLSTQGFTIALFYCFLNTEVQNTVRHHLERWKTARSLGGSRRYTYSSKDWSPRSRTESIRIVYPVSEMTDMHYMYDLADGNPEAARELYAESLYSQPAQQYRKRESTVSETTTTTLVGGTNFNGTSTVAKVSNGSGAGGTTVRATSISPLLMAENAV